MMATPVAHADTAACISKGGNADACKATSLAQCTSLGGSSAACDALGNNNSKTPAPTNDLGCGLDTKFDAGVCISNVVYVFTVGLGSGLAYVGGFMFDITVSLSLNSGAYALDFLSAGWTTARDLANMAFILILVYIAFTIMFQAETAGTIRMLALVIFVALIINFSFFFTRLVIDAGNILAVQFYNSIDAPVMSGTIAATNGNTGTLAGIASGAAQLAPQDVFKNTKDLTAGIMQALNIQELFNDNNFKKFAQDSGFASKFIILSFLYLSIGACYFILAAMFMAVAVKFLMRIVVLWFLIIASPLAFVAKAIPGRPTISGYYDEWQKMLISHAFYPAFFLFIFFFISTIMTSLGSGKGILGGLASDLSRLAADDQLGGFIFIASSVANVGIRLGFVVAMLYIGLKVSEAVGVRGAEGAQKLTTFAFGQTGRLAASSTGWVGRNTAGRFVGQPLANVSTKAGNRALLANNWVSKKAWQGAAAVTGRPGNALAKATYDPRNAPGASVLRKAAEKVTGPTINTGKAPEGGIAAKVKERAARIKEEHTKRSALLRDGETKELVKQLAEKSERHDALETKAKTVPLNPDETKERQALKTDINRMANTLNSLGKREIENVKAEDLQKVLKHAKEGVVKKVEESEKFTEKEKADVREKHTEQMSLKEQVTNQKKLEDIGEKSIEKSQELIDELRSVKAELEHNAGILPHALPSLRQITTSGTKVTPALLKSAEKEVRGELIITRNRLVHATDDTERRKQTEASTRLQEAQNHIRKLKEHAKEIPANMGGAPNAQEFLVA